MQVEGGTYTEEAGPTLDEEQEARSFKRFCLFIGATVIVLLLILGLGVFLTVLTNNSGVPVAMTSEATNQRTPLNAPPDNEDTTGNDEGSRTASYICAEDNCAKGEYIWTEHKCVNNVCVGEVNWPLVFVFTIVALLILVILFGMLHIALCNPWR